LPTSMQPHYLNVGFGRTWWAHSSMTEKSATTKHKTARAVDPQLKTVKHLKGCGASSNP
jgi:hypothetical protein